MSKGRAPAQVFLFLHWVWGMSAIASVAGAANPSAGCSLGSIAHGRRIERTITVGDVEREYILDVPESVTPGEPVPLLFDFHGFGHSGAGVWGVSAFKELAVKERFVTVYPTGLPITIELLGQSRTGPGWQMQAADDNRDVAFTLAMLDEIEKGYCIDRDRVYSTGFSNGAFFSNLLGCVQSERFAAIAPVSGAGVRGECRPSRPVAVMIHHGTADELISVERARASRDQWLAANGCDGATDALSEAPRCQRNATCRGGAVVVYCEEDFAHRWPPQATERIWTFLKGHSLGRQGDPG